MKNSFFITLLLLLGFNIVNAQSDINQILIDQDANVQQIAIIIQNDIINLQTTNNESENLAWAKQTGNYNKTNINQQKDQGLGKTNLAYTLQQGDANEISLEQNGKGNVFLSLQLGYLTINAGKRNQISAIQEGANNELRAIQSGEDNSISTEQKGINNNLQILQQGTNNSVIDRGQANISETILYDTIIQNGDHLSLTTDDAFRSTANKNTFVQSGSNLSLTIENEFINSSGGIEVNQTGHDMKVLINQSYFPTPLN